MELSHEHRDVLSTCYERTQWIAATEQPTLRQRRALAVWQDETEFGPRYSCRSWFGKVSPAERMRYRRAIQVLDEAGLLVVTSFEAFRARTVIHMQLKTTGETIARQLLTAETQQAQ